MLVMRSGDDRDVGDASDDGDPFRVAPIQPFESQAKSRLKSSS